MPPVAARTPREDVPLESPADGFDPFGMRHSGRARGRPGVRGGIGHRLLSLDTEPVGAFDAVEREGEAGEVLRRRLRALAEVGHRGQRQRSQGLDRERALRPSAPGSRGRCPFLGKAIGLALQANQAVHALGPATLGGSRTRAASCARDQRRTVAAPRTDALDDLVHGGAVLDRAATASWIAAGSGWSDEPPPIAPAVLRSLSHCVARIRAREDDRRMAQV